MKKKAKYLSCDESVKVRFVNAPVFYISMKDLQKGKLQPILKRYTRELQKHPIILLRPKKFVLPKLKDLSNLLIKVNVKKFQSFKKKPICSMYLEAEKCQTAEEYVNKAKSEGCLSRIEFYKTLFVAHTQEYCENIDNPSKFLDLEKCSFKWDLEKENGLLGTKIPGVNTPYLYFGSKNSCFALHSEDGDLYSMNEHLGGASKLWWAVHKDFYHQIKKFISKFEESKLCDALLRHKSHFLNVAELQEQNITVYEIEQNPGDIILTSGLHMGGNLGFNINIAVNFAIDGEIGTKDVIDDAEKRNCSEKCKFETKSVSLNMLKIRYLNCDYCNQQFLSDQGMKDHYLNVHKEVREKNVCPFCKESFSQVVKHIQAKHKSYLHKQRCSLCRKMFQDIWALRKHWTDMKKTQRYCSFCKRKFKYFGPAMSHVCCKKEK